MSNTLTKAQREDAEKRFNSGEPASFTEAEAIHFGLIQEDAISEQDALDAFDECPVMAGEDQEGTANE